MHERTLSIDQPSKIAEAVSDLDTSKMTLLKGHFLCVCPCPFYYEVFKVQSYYIQYSVINLRYNQSKWT